MWRLVILISGFALLATACAAPEPTFTATALPVQVEATAKPTTAPPPAPPTATAAPTVTLTVAPTPTKPLPSSTPTHPPAATTAAPPPSPAMTATPEASATPEVSATPTAAVLLPAGVTAQDVANAEQRMVDLINAERAAHSLAPLARDETLMGIARARAADMVARHYTGHYDPVTGVGLGKAMMTAAGYTSGFKAENWDSEHGGVSQAVDGAMAFFIGDPSHEANIISPNFVGVGVGLAFDGKEWLIVQDFAGKNQ